MRAPSVLPEQIPDEATLEEALSRPSPGLIQDLADLSGDLVLLGAGGKIGPSLAVMAQRALRGSGSSARVIAVSRFSDDLARKTLEGAGVVVHPADLSVASAWDDLPEAGAMIYLAARKFGSVGQEPATWWSNAALPTMACARYAGVPTVVYSTGNVYPLTPLVGGGSVETDPLGPVGEYAQSCLARERLFSHASQIHGTPVALFRLNYACELRYGVIADLAAQIISGEPVDTTMPAVNVVWQGDANDWALRSLRLARTPAVPLNATGPETVSIRRIAAWLAEDLGIDATLTGTEQPDALLSDAALVHEHFGYPTVPLRRMVRWVAAWVGGGGRQLGRPTKFQQRRGQY